MRHLARLTVAWRRHALAHSAKGLRSEGAEGRGLEGMRAWTHEREQMIEYKSGRPSLWAHRAGLRPGSGNPTDVQKMCRRVALHKRRNPMLHERRGEQRARIKRLVASCWQMEITCTPLL